MRELSISSQGSSNTYLIIRNQPDDRIDDISIGMMINNDIPGFLPFSFRQMNQGVSLYYNITSLTPLKKAYSALTTEKKLLAFLRSLCGIYMECEEYLLDPGRLWMTLDTVFIHTGSGKIQLLYLPFEKYEDGSIKELIQCVMQQVKAYFENGSAVFQVLYENLFMSEFSVPELSQQLDALQDRLETVSGNEDAVQNRHISDKGSTDNRKADTREQRQPDVSDAAEADDPYAVHAAAEKKQIGISNPFRKHTEKNGSEQESQKPQEPEASEKANASEAADDTPDIPDFQTLSEKSGSGQKGSIWGHLFGSSKGKPVKGESSAQPEDPEEIPSFIAIRSGSVRNGAQPQQGQAVYEEHSQPPRTPDIPERVQEASTKYKAIPEPEQELGDGYTVSLKDDETDDTATRLMGDDSENTSYWLVRKKTGERTLISHDNFHVGRGKNVVDYFVETETIYLGNDHAYFTLENGICFIVDNNSKNHTWLNGKKLEPSAKYPITYGDEIRMADEYFHVN